MPVFLSTGSRGRIAGSRRQNAKNHRKVQIFGNRACIFHKTEYIVRLYVANVDNVRAAWRRFRACGRVRMQNEKQDKVKTKNGQDQTEKDWCEELDQLPRGCDGHPFFP